MQSQRRRQSGAQIRPNRNGLTRTPPRGVAPTGAPSDRR
nr:MAG TPA: hypothetical protein [Caudoviricetes sp.]